MTRSTLTAEPRPDRDNGREEGLTGTTSLQRAAPGPGWTADERDLLWPETKGGAATPGGTRARRGQPLGGSL